MFASSSRYLRTYGLAKRKNTNKEIFLHLYKYKLQKIENKNVLVRKFHTTVGDIIVPSQVTGISHLTDPRLNKGLAFTLEERQVFGIHGLQAPRFKTQEEQLDLCRIALSRYQDPLNKYLYLSELQDRNEKLFYRLLSENIENMMPIVYTPTVGLACQKFGLIYRRPRGLFITINDRGHVFDVLKNWPENDVRCIVVTDGERILGLGDLGACGMGIPVGKLALYTALAGIKPHQCLPITLDVGTNNQNYLEDPLYIGLRQGRTTGAAYDDFINEFMEAVVERYGQNTLIQFEDFGNHNAFKFLEKYKDSYCTFNDDIQGTGAVVLAGIMASRKITKKTKISDNIICFYGAGEAGLGIAELLVTAMTHEGISAEEARSKIWMMDTKGLIIKQRPEKELPGTKILFAKDHAPVQSLLDLIIQVKPTILIGAAATGGVFTPEILKAMSTITERPLIFALSNPTSKSECTGVEAYTHTDGQCIFASGSPFGTIEYKGKIYKPGQGNNAYSFPGLALGVIVTGIHHITEDMFLLVANTLANMVTDTDIGYGSIYPPISKIREASFQIALVIIKYAYEKGQATVYPEPENKVTYIQDQLFNYNYECVLPKTWTWPSPPHIQVKPLDPEKIQKKHPYTIM